MRIAVIGSTGLIGRKLAPLLAAHDVLVLSRSPTGVDQARWREILAPAADWPAAMAGESIDAAISTLGTTWNKAGSWDAFEAVDRTAVVDFAQAARKAGATQMISVSSVGADPNARNAYLKLKGRVEADLVALGFGRLDLIRPGLLRGERGGDRRLGERIGIVASPLVNLLLRGPLDRFQAIDADQVASAIAALLGREGVGRHVHENRDLRRLAGRDGGQGPR